MFNSRLMCIMYLTSLLLAELCICATSWPLIEEQGDTVQEMDFFEIFKKDFGKVYRSASEELTRRRIFAENLDYISQHNRQYRLGNSTFYLGVNAYTDLELQEFISVTSDNNLDESAFKGHLVRPSVSKDYPASVDWRKNGSVTPVRAQGNCNSGWAFTAVGSIEGQYKQKTGKLVPFSAQQLIDCPYPHPGEATYGCAGGNVTNAYISIAFRTNGIEPDSDYPYEAKNNTCRFKSTLSKARVTGWTEMGPPRTEESLKHMVAGESNGPVAVRIDGSHSSFQHYKGGIYDEPNCSSKSVNHAVLLVGYNTSPDYWIVKNSFGTSWGEEGYIRMIRNKNNQCGITNKALYPDIQLR